MTRTAREKRRNVHGANAEPDKNALRKDVLVILGRDACHHRAEDEHERADDHDWPRAVRVEQPANERALPAPACQ